MRYVTIATDKHFQHLIEDVQTLAEENSYLLDEWTVMNAGIDLPADLPYCERDAWEGDEEDILQPLGYMSIYYQKVSDPDEKDLRPRQLMPIETYESKAGHLLMRAYDLNAGFVKSFRLDAVQSILVRNQFVNDNRWGLKDIRFRGRYAPWV